MLESIWIRKVEDSNDCCLFVHGRAGNYNVMSAFSSLIPKNVSIVSVQAPYQTTAEDLIGTNVSSGFSWWSGRVREKADQVQQQEIDKSLALLEQFCEECSPKPRFAAGFSQGAAMLSMLIQKRPDLLERCALLAGFVIPLEGQSKPTTKVLMTNGSKDEIISVDWARAGAEVLKTKGFDLTYIETDAGHKVGAQAMGPLKNWFI